MLGSHGVYLTIFLVILRFFYARPVGLYGATVSVICTLSERGQGLKKNNPQCSLK